LIYYDELIPLHIYRQFHRPTSDLAWVCTEGMLFKQFKESSQHHYWTTAAGKEKGQEATICVKREPVRLCLTMPGLVNDSEVADLEHNLSSWHSDLFRHQNLTTDMRTVSNILTTLSCATLSGEVAKHIAWKHAFAALIPVQFPKPTSWKMQEEIFLASVITQRCQPYDEFLPIGYIPNSSRVLLKKWELNLLPSVYSDNRRSPDLNRFTFLPGSFKALELPRNHVLLESSIKFEDEDEVVNRINTSWLSQANMYIRETKPRYRYGVVDALGCAVMVDTESHDLLRPEGTTRQAHIFVCPVSIRHEGPRIGLEFPDADQMYWSLDPCGNTRMTQDECDAIGLPRLRFLFLPIARFWHEYHYNAIREFYEAKGFDPNSDDVTRLLDLPLAQVEPNIVTNIIPEASLPSSCC